ncbi:MAG: hypothetical protein MI864_01660, partial [Pseudomonadales bacterium]|nr:hypothetical protein [Pseudomonadales bacterium]
MNGTKQLTLKLLATIIACTGTASQASNLTLYSDFAVVQDNITLNLKAGDNAVALQDITRHLEPSSVMLSPGQTGWNLIIKEQNYQGSPLDQVRLLQQYEGQEIEFIVRYDDHQTIKRGKIIRAPESGGMHAEPMDAIVEWDGKVNFGLPGTPLFPPIKDQSALKPQLDWQLFSSKSGKTDASLSYITRGFGWDAAYNFIERSETKLDAAGWMTIRNYSGKDFEKSNLKLVAGEVNKLAAGRDMSGQYRMKMAVAESMPAVTEKSIDEFHMYTVPYPVDLQAGQTKQIQFLSGQNISYQTELVYDGANLPYNFNSEYIRTQRDFGARGNDAVNIYKVFENSAKNGLGKPLPSGRIRFYEQDDDGSLIFTGENRIDHTAREETVKVFTGSAFDVKGERKQTEFTVHSSQRQARETFKITLTNRKAESVSVKVVEHLYRGPEYNISSQTKWQQDDASTI